MKKDFGFTLIELMITLAVLAILIGLAAPSMNDLIRNNRVASVASEFGSAITYTRAEAIKRGQQIVLCQSSDPSATPPTCANAGGWQQGWLAFVDSNSNSSFDNGETILRVWQTPSPGADISSTNPSIVFNARGMPTATDTYTVCMNTLSRILSINAAGRLNISAGTCS